MPEYCAYLLDAEGHIAKRIDFESTDDATAISHARQYVDGRDVEVWQLKRRVATLSHKDESAR